MVIVSYRSARTLRGCVEPLSALPGVRVTVVDNASPDDSLEVIADLPVDAVRSERNGGFSYGCNLGARRGDAPFILFLNPDARIEADALETLVAALRDDPGAGLVAPRIVDDEGKLLWSLRRFPRQRSTFGLALFAHRLWPRSRWSDELVRDPAAYERPGHAGVGVGRLHARAPERVRGAGRLRRGLLPLLRGHRPLPARLGCPATRCASSRAAEIVHVEGSSSGAGETQPILAQSRVRYARKHMGTERGRRADRRGRARRARPGRRHLPEAGAATRPHRRAAGPRSLERAA